MRRAVVMIQWEGADKPIRELIEEYVDRLFMAMTETEKVLYGDTQVTFTARVKGE